MKSLFLLSALLALSKALPPIGPTVCVPDCECKDILLNFLDVTNCSRPIVLNSTLLSRLDKRVITVIRFSNVIIEQITEDAFKRFPFLEDVIIEKAQIGSVDEKAFNNILKVKFADCAFEDSPDLSSERLEELHFGNCRLDEIPDLSKLFSLQFLNLSGNYIRDVDIDILTFAELFDLETLILSNNEIKRLPANIFVNNGDLSSLYLDNNPLKYFYLNTSTRLETLSLKNCYLSNFDEKATQHLGELIELNLSNNKLTHLSPKVLEYMKELSVIDLSNNSLKMLDDDIFRGNPKLQRVTLDGNKFSTLPNFTLSNDAVFQIYAFSCKDCGLKTVHKDTFKYMPALFSLNLAHNNFTFVQNMFDYISSLRMLDISYNNINILAPGAFDNNKNLETLNIAGNPLLALNPENFAETKSIRRIDARNCRLYKLWTNNGTTLKYLNKLLLGDNQLTTLSIADFKIVPSLENIDLHNNPFKFDSQMCDTINYLDNHAVFLIEHIDLKGNPGEQLIDDDIIMKSNPWSNFHKNQCPETSNALDESENQEDEDLEDSLVDDQDLLLLQKMKSSNDDANDDDDDDYDDSYEDDDDIEDDDDKYPSEILEDKDITIVTRASYILSVTTVFVLTALAVLIIAVTLTLCILRRNNNFNMHRANLPRFKIPLWETQITQKKHSGSVYRPLSEDLSGPRTPKCSRYEFAANPTVHST